MNDLNIKSEELDDKEESQPEDLNFQPIDTVETLDDLEAELLAEAEAAAYEETAEERAEQAAEEKKAQRNGAENQAQLMGVIAEISGAVKELSNGYYEPKGAKGFTDQEAFKLTASGLNVVKYFFPVDQVDPKWVALGTFAAIAWSLHKARMPDIKAHNERKNMRDVTPQEEGPEI